MEELKKYAGYQEFRDILGNEIVRVEDGFVKIGYLLKIARDTDILAESGYKSMTEFAAAEYRLGESYVSRFIDINDRYSEGGYSEHLQERFRGYGMTKLAEMLTLPESIVESIPPELPREDIRDLKREIKEEQKITDLEVLMEEPEGGADADMLQQAVRRYFYESREVFVKMVKGVRGVDTHEKQIEALYEALAPSGVAVLMVRVQGVGKLMLSIRGREQEIDIQNVRTLEKQKCSWEELLRSVHRLVMGCALLNPEKDWEKIYGEPFQEEKPEPVSTPEPKKQETKEKPARKPEPVKPVKKLIEPKREIAPAQEKKPEIQTSVNQEESLRQQEPQQTVDSSGQQDTEQIPGQDNVLNHPEYLPEHMTPVQVDGETVDGLVENSKDLKKEECTSLCSLIQGNIALEKFGAARQQAEKLLEQLKELEQC